MSSTTESEIFDMLPWKSARLNIRLKTLSISDTESDIYKQMALMDRQIGGWIGRWIDRWMDRQVDGQIDRWIDQIWYEQMNKQLKDERDDDHRYIDRWIDRQVRTVVNSHYLSNCSVVHNKFC